MSANVRSDEGTETEKNRRPADTAFRAARKLARFEIRAPEETVEFVVPEDVADISGHAESVADFVSPRYQITEAFVEAGGFDALGEPEDREIVMATTLPAAFEFDPELDEGDLAFRVVGRFENDYDDEKIAVETPAPWDTPDDMTAANEVVKTLPWSDEDAEEHDDLDEGVHYTFDERREAWTLDKHGAAALKQAAEAAGYSWSVETDETEDGDDENETLLELCRTADEGDHITVTYEKKNGNGRNTYEGPVHSAVTPANEYSHSAGLIFHDENDKTKQLRTDDEGTVGLYSSGHHPFMGAAVEAELTDGE